MTNQEKKVELQKYRVAVREADRLAMEIQRWQSTAEKMTPVIHLAPAGGAGGRSMELAVEQIDDLTRKLGEQQAEAVNIRDRIGAAINSMQDEKQREVLTLRYIQGLKWDSIADIMHYDVDAKKIFHIHGQALSAIELDTERHY